VNRFALIAAVSAFFIAAPVSAQSGPRIAHKPANGRPYSAAVQVGNMYWLSGKIGATEETRAMEEGRTGAETHNIMEQFEALLTELGMDFGNVVRGVVYLSDIADYGEMNAAYGEYFRSDPPSRVTVAVSDLVAGAAIEISFIAVKN
jgi:2-iminobutanoate/2-iminopropanoate deaminase